MNSKRPIHLSRKRLLRRALEELARAAGPVHREELARRLGVTPSDLYQALHSSWLVRGEGPFVRLSWRGAEVLGREYVVAEGSPNSLQGGSLPPRPDPLAEIRRLVAGCTNVYPVRRPAPENGAV